MAADAPQSLIRGTVEFLRKHPPFDQMDVESLRFLAGRLALAYFPRDAVILAPGRGPVGVLNIIQRGCVTLQQPAWRSGEDGTVTLAPGECFSVGALLERRAVTNPYVAGEDTFCYQLREADFRVLLDRSPRFREFCTHYLASLLRESRQLLQMQLSSQTAEQQTMASPLSTIVARAPVTCPPDTTLGSALRTMSQAKIGSIVIVDAETRPIGIFTVHDLLNRVALAQVPLGEPIANVMTPNPRTLPGEASAHEAAFAMARYGIRHVLMVEQGRLTGVITERDLFSLQRVSMRQIIGAIAVADSLGNLEQASRDIRRLAGNMLGQGVAAEQLTLIVSALNDQLTQRVIELEAAKHDLEGIAWCWVAFGSEGRLEQTLATDQDNGIIFADDGDPAAVRARLLPFAKAVNAVLDRCGFPLCKGNIMAGNPELCLSQREWVAKFSDWIRNTDPQALLNATIFFDFRPLFGAESLAFQLRDRLLEMTRGNDRFLHMMAQNALVVRPPLGVIKDFVVEDAGDYPGTLDLKGAGARMFVDVARIMSLATGVPDTSTAQRLRHAGPRLRMSEDEVSSAVESFFFIQALRLRRQQAEVAEAGGQNRIDPERLNSVDRRMLKEALRQARQLQKRIGLDYQV